MSIVSTPTRESRRNLVGIAPDCVSNSYHHYSNSHRNFNVIHFDRNHLSIKETIGQGEYGKHEAGNFMVYERS